MEKKKFFAYIEYDKETNVYVGSIPSIVGAHTQALHIRLKEVLDLCLEEMDIEEKNAIPEFVKVEEIELV